MLSMGEIKKISSFIFLEALLCNISNASKSLGCMCREEIEALKEESLFILVLCQDLVQNKMRFFLC